MLNKTSRAFAWLIAGCTLFAAGTTRAAIMYGDFSDIPPGVVMYTDVTESSITDPVPPPRYGVPTVSGDNLTFMPMQFGSYSANGAADTTDVQLNFGIMAEIGIGGQVSGGITGLVIEEGGDFSLTGTGTSVTDVEAALPVFVTIREIDGVPVSLPPIFMSDTFTADLATSPGSGQPWSNDVIFDFSSIPEVANSTFGVTKADVVLNNTISSASESLPNTSTTALIMKKNFSVTPLGPTPNPDFQPIPEPQSVALVGCALALLLGYRKFA